MLHIFFSKLLSVCLPSSTLFNNWKVFFQKQYRALPIRSKMTLVKVVPNVVLHQKTHVPWAETFVGRSNWVPAPCALQMIKFWIFNLSRLDWILVQFLNIFWDYSIGSKMHKSILRVVNSRKSVVSTENSMKLFST